MHYSWLINRRPFLHYARYYSCSQPSQCHCLLISFPRCKPSKEARAPTADSRSDAQHSSWVITRTSPPPPHTHTHSAICKIWSHMPLHLAYLHQSFLKNKNKTNFFIFFLEVAYHAPNSVQLLAYPSQSLPPLPPPLSPHPCHTPPTKGNRSK